VFIPVRTGQGLCLDLGEDLPGIALAVIGALIQSVAGLCQRLQQWLIERRDHRLAGPVHDPGIAPSRAGNPVALRCADTQKMYPNSRSSQLLEALLQARFLKIAVGNDQQ
jgi:hypothetical protein